jgi:hypothetical protein
MEMLMHFSSDFVLVPTVSQIRKARWPIDAREDTQEIRPGSA